MIPMADKGKRPADESVDNLKPSKHPRLPSILPENMLGTDYIPIPVSFDSSEESVTSYAPSEMRRLHKELRKKKRECKDLEKDLIITTAHHTAERDCRMALEAHIGNLTERLNCLTMATESLVRVAERQGNEHSTHRLQLAFNLVKDALKKKKD